jgi:iron complex outermembrane receptor protein
MKISIGAQSNLRMENEGGSRVSLKMLLSSLLYNVQWMKRISPVSELILGNNFLFQNNTNYGSRIIIPNANTVESGATVFVKNKWGKVILETGVGMSVRSIHTFLTGSFNTADRAIETFTRTYPVMNASAGAVVNLGDHWNMKLNAGTGFRSGNLAELSSDGLHEGTFRYEIGDPYLKVEKNVNTETEIAFTASRVNFSLAAFFNQFFRYIYLSPTGEKYLGFDVFRYRQDNAHLAGGEATFSFQIPFYVPLQLESYFSSVRGILHNGEYLPFIPSDKWHTGLRLMPKDGDVLKNIKLMASIDTYFPQDHPAQFETPTSGYILLNAGCSVSFVAKKRTVYADIAANNLMNTSYFDHLSRFKEYGIYNIGRNLVLNIRLPFLLK